MTLPQCLEPIRVYAMSHGWHVDVVPYGRCIEGTDGHARMMLAAPAPNGAVVLHRYHTEALDYRAAEIAADVRKALADQNAEDARQRQIAKRAGERRSRKKGSGSI